MNRKTQTHTHKERERSNRVIKKKKSAEKQILFSSLKVFWVFSSVLLHTVRVEGRCRQLRMKSILLLGCGVIPRIRVFGPESRLSTSLQKTITSFSNQITEAASSQKLKRKRGKK